MLLKNKLIVSLGSQLSPVLWYPIPNLIRSCRACVLTLCKQVINHWNAWRGGGVVVVQGGAKEAYFPLSTAELNENPAWPDIPHLCPPRFLIIATYSSHLSNLPHSPAHASQWQLLPPVMGSITLFTHAPPPHCCLFRELCSLPGVLILKFHPCLIFVRVHLRAHSEQRYSLVWFYCRRAGWPVSTLVFSSFKSDFVRLSVQLLSHVRLCDPMNHSTPGLPVHHQLPEFTQTHVHRVGDAI